MKKIYKSSTSRICIALFLAVLMVLQPLAITAVSMAEGQPSIEKVSTTETAGEPLEIPFKDNNTISKPSELGWFDRGETGNSIEVLTKTNIDLYSSPEHIEMQRLILQKTTAVDIVGAADSGLDLKEADNIYSDKEHYKEYEITLNTDKQVSVFPMTLEVSEIKEGSVLAVLGKDVEGQWIKAEIIHKNNNLEIVEKAEGPLLEEGLSLESILGKEKADSEKALQEAKAKAEQETADKKALEEQRAKEEEIESNTIAENNTEEKPDSTETAADNSEKTKNTAAEEKESHDDASTQKEQKASVFITAVETGKSENILSETKYKLTNLEDQTKTVILVHGGEKAASSADIPYADYHVEQLQTMEGFELSDPIPTLHVDKEKIELQIENRRKESEKESIEKESAPLDGEILKSLIMPEESIKPLSLDSMTAMALSETARTVNETETKTQDMKTSLLSIKTFQRGSADIRIEGAYYEVANKDDHSKVYKLGPSGEDRILHIELPYGNYSVTQIVSGFGYEIQTGISDVTLDSEKEELAVENTAKPLELSSTETDEELVFRSMNLSALNTMAMEPRFAAAFDTNSSFGPYTGSIGGGLGTYSWSARASGDIINWTLTVNVSSRAWNQSPIAGYLEFSIPADQELQGSINSTDGVLLTDSPGRKYHLYTPNEKTVRTMQATFSTKYWILQKHLIRFSLNLQ